MHRNSKVKFPDQKEILQNKLDRYKDQISKSVDFRSLKDGVFRLRDPLTNKLIMEIKQPRVPILPIQDGFQIIDLEKSLETFHGLDIDFGYRQVEFENEKKGWEFVAEVLKPIRWDNKFWRMVKRLQEIKKEYNDLIE